MKDYRSFSKYFEDLPCAMPVLRVGETSVSTIAYILYKIAYSLLSEVSRQMGHLSSLGATGARGNTPNLRGR